MIRYAHGGALRAADVGAVFTFVPRLIQPSPASYDIRGVRSPAASVRRVQVRSSRIDPISPLGTAMRAVRGTSGGWCTASVVLQVRDMQTLVIIPTYNERDNIGPLVRAVLAVDPALDVLVVDDNSPDGTGALADALARETGRVRVLHRPGKGGLGTAYLAGFRDALDRGYARVVEMDADFSHRPEDLPSLLHAAEIADVVVGSRNVPGGRVENWSPVRNAISKGGSLYARTVLGLPIKDCTGGFKCFRREALTALDLDGVRSTGFGFQVELNYLCHRAGLRIAEVPIVFPDRTRGASKMSGRIAAEAALMVLQLRLDPVYLLARKRGGVVLAPLAIAALFWLLYSYPALILVAVPALLWGGERDLAATHRDGGACPSSQCVA